jgi:CheY-like chemotaxis protein
MNAIIGFSALLSEPGLDHESQQSYIETITQSSNNLLVIVSDIIEISNIEVGTLKFCKSNFNLNPLLNNLFKQFNPEAIEKGIEFRYKTVLSESDDIVQTDNNKLVQVLSKLLSNAFKFTSGGKIDFGYSLKNEFLEFYVTDTGIGISGDQHLRIFERFYQVESNVSRLYEGTGLGLPISKAYIELLGGKIWLISEKGKGSTFYFTIPYIKTGQIDNSKEKIEKIEKSITNDKKTVLVAEDEENNYILLVEFLSSLNLNFIHAINGKEAVEICESNQQVDLVLMDIKMPVMDGYEATSKIKKLRPGLPVIAQTAYAFDSEKEKAFSAGCIDYIPKPLKKESLISTIKKYL